ncbi:MAG: amino acid ABC transporter substrate-binding protein [Candidatus Glassbacteria bacterium]|nr:amino acid ABC transporter substrate-binding protein [Candidatus Glassbacteria bacterium]
MIFFENPAKLNFSAVILLLGLLACGPAARRAASPVAAVPSAGRNAALMRAVDAYGDGGYQRAAVLIDSLLTRIAPSDSQLNFLAAYYGIRARLALATDPAGLEAFLEPVAHLIPENQLAELRYLIDGPDRKAPGEHDLGPEVAYRIGVILPLSGRFYEFGEAILEGVRLAADEFNRNAAPGGRIELAVRDDRGEPVRAASLGRELATDSTVAALIGSHGNEASLSLALVSAVQNIPLICPTADAPGLDGIGNAIHVLNRTDPQLSAAVADASVKMMKLHTFAVVAEDDERGKLLADGFIDKVKEAGATVVADLRYPVESSNFENQMTLIQRYLPDAIYLTAKSDMITQLASQVYYYGMGGVQLIGGEYWDSERVIRMGGEYVDGGLFSSPFFQDSDRLRWHQFKTEYEETFRRPVNRFSAYGYDAVGIVLNSLQRVPASREALAIRLRSGLEYSGATGIYTVGADGRVNRNYFVLRLVSGSIVPAQAQPEDSEPPVTGPDQNPGNGSPSVTPY